MAIQDITIKKGLVSKNNGVVVFDLERYQVLTKELEEYRRKEKLLRNLKKFGEITKWGRSFARKNRIKPQQILQDD